MAPKLPVFSKISQEDLADAPKGKWLEAMTTPVNDSLTSTKTLLDKGLTFGQNINSEVKEVDILVPDPWISLTLSNAWANTGGSTEQAAYMKHPDGSVELKGDISGGVGLGAFAVLPIGYRPAKDFKVVTTSNNLFAVIGITALGVVSLIAGALLNLSVKLRFEASDSTPIANKSLPISFSTKFAKKPLAVIIASIEDISVTEVKRTGAVGHLDWDYGTVSEKPNIKISNICGLPYNRKYRLKLLIIGE